VYECPRRELTGKPDAGKPHVRFDEGRGYGPAYSTGSCNERHFFVLFANLVVSVVHRGKIVASSVAVMHTGSSAAMKLDFRGKLIRFT